MVVASTTKNPNPKYKKPQNAYHVGGIQVEFPYQPYGSQLAFMCRVISTLDRAHREGHCHALLESPTGTGKSLSLLCSALAWQQSYKLKNQYGNLAHSKPNPEAMNDPLTCGGGFIPESQPSSIPPSANAETVQVSTSNKNQKKKMTPTIFYASRTHSQISQVISEYRKTAYRVPMAVLASRKHYCTNRHVRGKENIDEECKLLLGDREVGCPEFKNVHKVKGHPSLQKGGCHEVHDIEDLVKVGQVVRGCSYYAARSMADDAQLVFCPYSYIINPVIRGAMEVDIKGAIIILDEAHNIEDISRDAGSVDIEEDVLLKLQMELGQLCSVNAIIYQPLSEMTQDLIGWIERRKTTLAKREFQHYFSCWTGDQALRELQEANISQQCFPILLDCATKAIKESTDTESEAPHLSGMSVITLEGLFSSLTYFFSRNSCHVSDYQLALQRYIKRGAKNSVGGWTHTFSLWCLNPAVVFKDVAELSLSVILTSGTLSPMNSFSSELGVQFGTCLEAPHVIDVDSQVRTVVISTGPDNYPLNASYKTADGYAFQDALGKSLEQICNVVPGGSLVFFPSYKLMEKLCNRWRETGQWSRLDAKKPLFLEPKAGSQEDFELILKDYYNSVLLGKKPAAGRKKKIKKGGINDVNANESHENTKKYGAGFLAVCRGKVSEGIDFSDDNARAVIVVGIPFPNINDIQVSLKKKYNDAYKSSRDLLSGNEWYCHQAFRALNQAIGRCIRHRFDYGAIILLDERFLEERNRGYISKWLRRSIRQYDSFHTSLEELKSFFRDVKDRVSKNTVNNNADNVASVDQRKEFAEKKTQKLNKSDHSGEKLQSLTKYGATFSQQESQGHFEVQTSVQTYRNINKCIQYIDLESEDCIDDKINHSIDTSEGLMKKKKKKLNSGENSGQRVHSALKYNDPFPKLKLLDEDAVQGSVQVDNDNNNCKDYVNPECSSQKYSWCCEASSMPFSSEEPIVKETPGMDDNIAMASPGSVSKDGNSSSTIFQASMQSPDQLSFYSKTVNLSSVPSKTQAEMVVTPEKEISENTSNLPPERDSSLSLSVNSHTQKRRKTMFSPSVDLKLMASREANRRIEFGLETNYAENKSKKSNIPMSVAVNKSPSSHLSSSPVLDKRLQLSCSLCRSPLGRPENHLYVKCSILLSTKAHLQSLLKERLEPGANVSSIPVIMTDISLVDPQLHNRTLQGASGQGVWCEEDGCVYNTIFCPFCSIPDNCLGVQIVASDASNFQLLSKLLFYLDHLEIRNPEAEKDKSENKDSLPINSLPMDKGAAFTCIEKFSYSPQQEYPGGWRTTKSKLRLPKRADANLKHDELV
ncbi:Fanconi anemia group J protein-like [Melia azedarach]|uniref:Fanconi anemia group J protein-like n=1 Tax=Melia azedarach TaxID=155640 RepID=A0ACC1WTS4_MELAZ|nr:Fanconi anemia group J protein-like [Melia azedarach]